MIKEGFKDEIIIRTEVHLSWFDWFKILFGKTLWVTTRTQSEHMPGRLETISRCYVERLIPSREPQAVALTPKLRSDRDDASPERIAAQDGRRFG